MQKIFNKGYKIIAIKIPIEMYKKLKAKGVNISELVRNFLKSIVK